MSEKFEVTIKIVVITDSVDYAMTYLNRHMHDRFAVDYVKTVGALPMARYQYINGVKAVLSFWLTSDDIRFKVMQQMFHRDANYFLILNKNADIDEKFTRMVINAHKESKKEIRDKALHLILIYQPCKTKDIDFEVGPDLKIHELPIHESVILDAIDIIRKEDQEIKKLIIEKEKYEKRLK